MIIGLVQNGDAKVLPPISTRSAESTSRFAATRPLLRHGSNRGLLRSRSRLAFWYPPKWRLNEAVEKFHGNHSRNGATEAPKGRSVRACRRCSMSRRLEARSLSHRLPQLGSSPSTVPDFVSEIMFDCRPHAGTWR
mgnify:CR=1 FL=1